MEIKHLLKNNSANFFIPLSFLLIGTVARIVPHPPNFAPIASMALFGGTYFNKKYALVLPILAMVISDFFIGFDSFASRASVYGSFILIGLIGLWLRSHKSLSNVIVSILLSSVLFFIITNFAVWLFSGMYPKTSQGLVSAYILALPFFRNSLAGDVFYSGLFFGVFEFVKALIIKKRTLFVKST